MSFDCDVLIIGASLGGVSAALSAADLGVSVTVADNGAWVGGQLTSQGVCTPDENEWIELGGGIRSYLRLRSRVRDYYRSNYRLSPQAFQNPLLNPGNCWVSRISGEPKVFHALLQSDISSRNNISLIRYVKIPEFSMIGSRIDSVLIRLGNHETVRLHPHIVLDATETGELLPLTDTEYVIGAESREETGEPDAPERAHPEWVQPFTFPFGLELRPKGENHVIPIPPYYEILKALQKYHVLDGAMRGMFGELSWWNYRRVLAAENFNDPAIPCDIAMINTGSNDFKGGVLPSGNSRRDRDVFIRGRLASLGYVYWLQTECPREDDGLACGYPELRLVTELFSTPDGIAPAPYIRESRRIMAIKTIREQDIVRTDGSGVTWQRGEFAEHQPDSCGIGHYWLDIHSGGSSEPGRFLNTAPFQIPTGALIPRTTENLLAACKNIGVTHLTNGAYRLHPIEWNIGAAAGFLAAWCSKKRITPAELCSNPSSLREWQRILIQRGVPLSWPSKIDPNDPAFEGTQISNMGW